MKPKHLKTKKFVDSELFRDLHNFNQLESRISKLPDHERGDAFEVFAEAYFATQKISQAADVWPDKEIPISLRDTLGLFKKDMGIDGIIRTKEDHYHAYQVKFRSNRTNLTWEELSTFMGMSDRVHKRVLFTNSCDLPALMQDRTDFYAVKGNDLDILDESDFQCIEEWLKSGAFEFKRKTPKPYQNDALVSILSTLNAKDRTTAVMACGTGKTLISLWLAERMNVNSIVVLVPSLSLIRQMLHEWMKETVWQDYSFLCVCSDKSVAKGIDEIVLHQTDLDFPVTTSSESIHSFLQNKPSQRKIIFSTYHSSKVLAQGLPDGYSFDLGIFDEAHKTTGREGTTFGFALKNENLSIQKRLFLTATPRHYDIKKKDREGNLRLVFSMDNPEIYGTTSYKLSFASAAAEGIICPYKIVISIVTDETITRDLLKRGEVIVNGDVIKANQIAQIFALKTAIEKFNVKQIFTFHSSVDSAKSFTSSSEEGAGAYLDNFSTYHVNGEMPTSTREKIMREFEKAPQAIISNARCLTEGVNVPAVDMVVFMSPKKSKVDIVQAAGRAMRKPDGKQFGYILLPIHLQTAKDENLESALENTQFEEVWDVLEAMLEQDEDLAEIIQQMREDIGRKGGFDDSRLRERLEFLGPELEINFLRQTITTIIVDKLSSSWDERYGELARFREKYGHCNVPDTFLENPKLGSWVGIQRSYFKKNKLSKDKIEKLNKIGFVWNPFDAAWHEMFNALYEFKQSTGHLDVWMAPVRNERLCTWVQKQRQNYSKNKLALHYIKKLEEIGFVWNPLIVAWKEMFVELSKFKQEHGHCNVKQKYPPNPQLATWVNTQRDQYKEGKCLPERVKRLEELGFVWDTNIAAWENMFLELCKFKDKQGHCNVPTGYPENPRLATWVTTQRSDYKDGRITSQRRERLEKIGFEWNTNESAWEKMYAALIQFKQDIGHCNVPPKYKNKQLGSWVAHQREAFRQSTLDSQRVRRLEELGFIFDPLNQLWDEIYNELAEFKNKNGHCNVPKEYSENPRLGAWVSKQRLQQSKGKLSSYRFDKLNQLDFNWHTLHSFWEEMFSELCKFKKEHGHCNVPRGYKKAPKLATWVCVQRNVFKKNKLPKERLKKLTKLGFVLDPNKNAWEGMFSELCNFKNENGHCNVPKDYEKVPSLGNWVSIQRRDYKKGVLSKERAEKLTNLGFVWDPHYDQWGAMFAELLQYKSENGHCNVSQRYEKNLELARWVGRQRNAYKKGLLPQERIVRLEQLGLVWNVINDAWEDMFSELLVFKNSEGHCNVPQYFLKNPKLGGWVSHQRDHYRQGILLDERITRLQELGFCWDPNNAIREEMLQALYAFKTVNGHCNIPSTSKFSQLAGWVVRQRTSYRKGSICPELKGKLDAINFNWEPFANSWEEMFNSLCEFQKEHGHCNVPARYKKNMKLGRWIDRQRQSHRNGQISQEYKERLEKLGLVWNPISDVWEDMYLKLCNFKIVNGHLNISKAHNEKKLMSWVNWQRYNYKKGKLNEEYVLKLTNLGISLDK